MLFVYANKITIYILQEYVFDLSMSAIKSLNKGRLNWKYIISD